MDRKDRKIIIGILRVAAIFFLLALFLTEFSSWPLTKEEGQVSVPEEEETPEETRIFYQYEGQEPSGPQPEDREFFESVGYGEDLKEVFVLETGEKLDLKAGYTLEIKQIDSEGGKVWLEISREGEFIDDEILLISDSWKVQLDGENGRTIEIYVDEVLESGLELEVRQGR